MKKLALGLLSVLFIVSCKQEKQEPVVQTEEKIIAPIDDQVLESAVIYEANIRQYSPEGTFDAFTKDIPQLKDLGVKIIWLMPVHPISEERRKATGGIMVSEIEDVKEREKYLGSYYAVADYKALNPEFGTEEDFQELVDTAHENGIFVILDWVANHTGWDHPWIKEHPEYYTQNEKGEIIDPIDPGTGESWGWTDTADLNYENRELWDAMTEAMEYWVKEFQIDGFRADVAGEVPTPFWEQAVQKIERIRPVFMLAESEEKELFREAFDMGYNWEGHHLMNEIAQGKKTVQAWDEYMKKIDTTYEEDDFLMNFVTNHDENSWNGTVKERMGAAAETFIAFSYTIPGMPLIYSGQEYGLDHRLKFFEKDTIPKTRGENWKLFEKLGALKNENKALNGAKNAASYKRISTSADTRVIAFRREKDGETIFYVANLTKAPVEFTANIEGSFEDYMTAETFEMKPKQKLTFAPWQYKILISN